MRQLLFILPFWFIVFQVTAQDTVYSQPQEMLILDFNQRDLLFSAGCAHGHICCSVGCQCCTQLQRAQCYDTIYYPVHDGVQRITIVERYRYASTYERSPVHFRFKQADGQLSRKWYLAETPSIFYFDVDGFERYPKELDERYQEQNAILVSDETGSFQRIDLQGNLLPMVFQSRQRVDDNVFLSMIIVNDHRYYGFSDSSGALIGPLKYTNVLPFNEDGIAIVVDAQGLNGLVNCAGKEILPLSSYGLIEVGRDRYAIAQNGTLSLINAQGKPAGKSGYARIKPYSEGKGFAHKEQRTKTEDNLTWVCLDMNGNELFSLKAEWVDEFHDGLAGVYKNKKWGFIDTTGALVIDPQYERIYPFENGVAPVCIKRTDHQEEWFLIDRKGHALNSKRYGELSAFKNGIARATVRGQGVGLIDTRGKEILPCQYLFEGYGTPADWFIDGTVIAVTPGKERTALLLNRKLEVVLDLGKYLSANYVLDPTKSYRALPFLIVYTTNRKSTLIDLKGNEFLSRDYDQLIVLNATRAIAKNGHTYCFIDLITGDELLKFPDTHYFSFEDELLMVQTNDYPRVTEYYDVQGKRVISYGSGQL